jgi:AcrR family transcriptional regulator
VAGKKVSPQARRSSNGDPARDRILMAARKLFFEQAYEDVTVDALAAEAKASKTTIYKRFKDKDAILAAVIERESRRLSETMPTDETDSAVWNAVSRFGVELLRLILDPQVARFEQLVISQSRSARSVASLFYGRAHSDAYSRLSELLDLGTARGEFSLQSDPRTAAVDLVSLWKADLHERGQLNLLEAVPEGLESHVARCMRLVLRR